jgi:ABC-type transport system involved in cytochrome bd biosynthesis fused ATPase/permease subunit
MEMRSRGAPDTGLTRSFRHREVDRFDTHMTCTVPAASRLAITPINILVMIALTSVPSALIRIG